MHLLRIMIWLALVIRTQNLTKKNAAWGPLSNRSRKPPVSSGNLSEICRISIDCKKNNLNQFIHKWSKIKDVNGQTFIHNQFSPSIIFSNGYDMCQRNETVMIILSISAYRWCHDCNKHTHTMRQGCSLGLERLSLETDVFLHFGVDSLSGQVRLGLGTGTSRSEVSLLCLETPDTPTFNMKIVESWNHANSLISSQ